MARTIRAAVVSGSAASLLSALALAICGRIEEGSAVGPLNGPSQWLWGEQEAHTRRLSLRHTATGYAVHHSTSIMWATIHEWAFGGSQRHKSAARLVTEAAFTAGVAYFVDYNLTPRRLRPGFKKHLDTGSLFAVYSAFAAGLALTQIVRRRSDSLNSMARRTAGRP